jgi:biopolymer transport protein TolQ
MSANISVWQIVANASVVVQIILAILVAASITSWAIIFRKRQILGRARTEVGDFEKRFWSGADLSTVYKEVTTAETPAIGMETIFEAGFAEFARLRKPVGGAGGARTMESVQRAMRVAEVREIDRLEENLAFLATVGSTSPYVGLFGTVWGIMTAFSSLGNVQHATISMVAPGISEALIATAMGLVAAIPAVVAYNRYANQIERLETRFDMFVEEFSTILERHVISRAA